MKFECDSCHAQYMIADEKVGKRGVKVKCKRCSHVIVVRPDANKSDDVAAPTGDADARGPGEGAGSLKPGAEQGAWQDSSQAAAGANDENAAGKPAAGAADDASTTRVEQNPRVDDGGEPTLGGSAAWANDPKTALAGQTEATVVNAAMAQPGKDALGAATLVGPQPVTIPAGTPDVPRGEGPSSSPSTAGAFAGESSVGDALDDQIAGAFNNMFDDVQLPALDELRASSAAANANSATKVIDDGAMDALRRQARGPADIEGDALASLRRDLGPGPSLTAKPSASVSDVGPGPEVWHAAVDDKEVGPVALPELGRLIEAGQLDRQTLVWKAGMADWLPAGDVPEVRTLFDALPAPRIAPLAAAGRGPSRKNGFGAEDGGVDQPSGTSPFDQAPPFSTENSDPSWRPHGLTDVYQAANLAEAAAATGVGGAGLSPGAGAAALGGLATGLGAGPSPLSGRGVAASSSAGEPEWRPSASSALASLVSDEMDRITKGPTLTGMAGADVAPDGGGLGAASSSPFASLGLGASLDSLPDAADPLGRARATTMPPTASHPGFPVASIVPGAMGAAGFVAPSMAPPGYGQPGFPTPSFPAVAPAAPPPQRSPLVYLGIAGVLVLVAMLGVVIWGVGSVVDKVADKGEPRVVLVGPNGLPVTSTPPAAAAPPVPTPPVPPTAPAVADAGVAVPPPAAAAPPVPPEGTGAQVAQAGTPAPSTEGTTGTNESKGSPRDGARPDTKGETKAGSAKGPKPAGETGVKPKPSSVKGDLPCDPVLDFGCKPAGGVVKAAAKETLEKGDILPVVRDTLPKVKACGAKDGATGQIKMSWKIAKDGRTTDVTIADPKWGGTPLGSCVSGVVKTMRFPAYSGKAPPPVSIALPLQ
jgi:predicted Zn finger-like uncharacterized protein